MHHLQDLMDTNLNCDFSVSTKILKTTSDASQKNQVITKVIRICFLVITNACIKLCANTFGRCYFIFNRNSRLCGKATLKVKE